jgi:hypothetical protein
MNANCHPFYSHSGRFGIQGPLLAIAAGLLIAYPLGIAYAYLVKWVPFIYLNFLITAGYSFVFGLLTAMIMKFGKVRSGPVALVTGLVVGFIAWYGNWNGYVHTLVNGAAWFLGPAKIVSVMKVLLKEGTWGIGRASSTPVTGIPLAIVWVVEAAIILGMSTVVSYGTVGTTPFCETHGCWLDEEKTWDKLDAFTRPDHLAAFQYGDIAPLEEAQARVPASGRFARLTLKHSPKCDDFCAFCIANVTLTVDKDGKQVEEVEEVLTNLWVPKSMFEYLAQFEHPAANATARG